MNDTKMMELFVGQSIDFVNLKLVVAAYLEMDELSTNWKIDTS